MVYVAIIALPEAIAVQDDIPSLLSFAWNCLGNTNPVAERDPQRTPRPPRKGNRANWLSAEVSFIGGGIRYERDINNFFR